MSPSGSDNHIVLFVVQGGSVCYDNDYDLEGHLRESKAFKENFLLASGKYYPASRNNISVELIHCPSHLSSGVLEQLRNIHYTTKLCK